MPKHKSFRDVFRPPFRLMDILIGIRWPLNSQSSFSTIRDTREIVHTLYEACFKVARIENFHLWHFIAICPSVKPIYKFLLIPQTLLINGCDWMPKIGRSNLLKATLSKYSSFWKGVTLLKWNLWLLGLLNQRQKNVRLTLTCYTLFGWGRYPESENGWKSSLDNCWIRTKDAMHKDLKSLHPPPHYI